MTALAPRETNTLAQPDFTADQINLIKQTVAAGTTDLELALFLEVAKSTGLNPFQRQIYAIKRKSGREEKMTIQTGIDGYRLIAARSGTHMGTTDPEFGPVSKEGFPEFARVVVRRLVQGQVAEFPATARWSEYVQTKDEWANGQRTGKKTVTDMWQRMPHTMLGKCAEALALRKAFPAELSGVYSDIEMAQADNTAPVMVEQQTKSQEPTPAQLEAFQRVQDMAARVRKVAPEQAVNEIADMVFADSPLAHLAEAYNDLMKLGLKHAPNKEAPAEKVISDTPEASTTGEVMATREQEQKLVLIAKDAGAATSEDRAALWGYMTGSVKPVPTKELTEELATVLLDTFAGLSPEDRVKALKEAKAALLGVML